MVRVGVLALQGDFAKHMEVLHNLKVEAIEVRKLEDLKSCEGLIIPGGESTVIIRQLDLLRMRESILEFAKSKPIFGTCAGLIVMSKHIQGSSMHSLQLLDVEVERNAYGRQIASFQAIISLNFLGKECDANGFFIRAPRIKSCGNDVDVLAKYEGEPVLVKQGFHLGATFHPELTTDSRIHQYFICLVKEQLAC